MGKPIPFSAAMVRALLAGTKTQTRRGLKPGRPDPSGEPTPPAFKLAYAVGDRLYVREHWRVSAKYDDVAPRDLGPRSMTVLFEAGGSISNEAGGWKPSRWPEPDDGLPSWAGRHRVGMHLPRWASRITLTMVGSRVERLRDITEADAIAEGIERVDQPAGVYAGSWRFYTEPPSPGATLADPRSSYLDLWDAINGPGTAAKNPWVGVYTFSVALGNIDVPGAG